MAVVKKKLIVKFKLVLDNSENSNYSNERPFKDVTEYKPDDAGNLLGNIRKALNKIYGFPVVEEGDSDPLKGFQDQTINSFNYISIKCEDVEDINPT